MDGEAAGDNSLHCFNQGLPVFGRAERVIIADSNKRCEDANFQHQQFIDQCQFSWAMVFFLGKYAQNICACLSKSNCCGNILRSVFLDSVEARICERPARGSWTLWNFWCPWRTRWVNSIQVYFFFVSYNQNFLLKKPRTWPANKQKFVGKSFSQEIWAARNLKQN